MRASTVTHARTRVRRLLWRTLRWLLYAALGSALLGTVAWHYRQQLLAPLLRPWLAAALAQTLGAEQVEIGAIDGGWLGDVDARLLRVAGGTGPLRALRAARVQAQYSLPALLGGDPAGLQSLQITVAEAELDLTALLAAPAPTTAPPPPGPPLDLSRWFALLPAGGRVQVERLQLRAPPGGRLGALAVTLDAGTGARHLTASFAGTHLDVQTVAAAPPALQVACRNEDAGALLDWFAGGIGLRGGTLRATADVALEPLQVTGQLELDDLAYGDQRLGRSTLRARLDPHTLAVEQAMVDLPGLAVDLQAVTLPNPLAPVAFGVEALTGRFAVRIDDLAPYARLLPVALQRQLPVQGQVAGAAADGRLWLGAGELRLRDATLRIEAGSLPLAPASWPSAEGSLRAAATLTGWRVDLPELGVCEATGTIDGELAGSLTAPRGDLRFELGECRSELGHWAGLQGRVRADAAGIQVERLGVQGLVLAASGSAAPTDLALELQCPVRHDRPDAAGLRVRLTADSLLPGEVMARLFASHGLGPAPSGRTDLRLDARLTPGGVAVEALQVRTAPDSPCQIAIDGDGVLAWDWSGGGAQTGAAAMFTLRASARRPATAPALPAVAIATTLLVAPQNITIRDLEVGFGPVQLRGAGSAAGGPDALLAPRADLGAIPLQLALELLPLDLASLPAAWLGAATCRGRLAGRASAAGPLRALAPTLRVTLVDGELQGDGLPTLAGAQASLDVASDAAEPAIVVTASATAALDPRLQLGPTLSLAARLRCDDGGTRLEPSVLQLGHGELRLELASDLRRAELLAGGPASGPPTLTGSVQLRHLVLDHVPARWLGLGSLGGTVDGEFTLDGRLPPSAWPAVVQQARLSWRDGVLKVDDLPRIEALAVELQGDRQVLTLQSLTGTLGAGRFAAHGALRATAAPLDAALEDAVLDLRLDGDDLLLYRGDGAKVRADLHATAAGPLRAIAVRGDVRLGRGTKYVRRISMLPALGTEGGEAVSEGLRLAPLPPWLGGRLDLDLALRSRDPVELRTQLVDGDIDVAARLRGSGAAPRLEGTMSMRRGVLRFPGANLFLDNALLTFTPSAPMFPELVVNATGRRMGIVVSMAITGRYDRPQVQLSSVPALPPQDLIVLLTTGQLPSTLAEQGAMGQAQVVGGYLAKEVFERYFGSESTERGASPFDRLTIETGREVSQNGVASLLVEYELVPRCSVRVERDQYEDYNLGLVLRFRFR